MAKYKPYEFVFAKIASTGKEVSGMIVEVHDVGGRVNYKIASLPHGEKIFVSETEINSSKSKSLWTSIDHEKSETSESYRFQIRKRLEHYLQEMSHIKKGLLGFEKKVDISDGNTATIAKLVGSLNKNICGAPDHPMVSTWEIAPLIKNVLDLVIDMEKTSPYGYKSHLLQDIYVSEIKRGLDKKTAIADEMTTRVQRLVRDKRGESAFEFMTGNGYVWNHEYLERTFDSSAGVEYIKALSKKNIATIKSDLINSSGSGAGKSEITFNQALSSYEADFLRKFLESSFVISHYTSLEGRNKICEAGSIISKVQLTALLANNFKNNTPVADEVTLGNHDMVFFRFEAGRHRKTGTRYGDYGFVYDVFKTSLLQHGWVTLNDQLDPYFSQEKEVKKFLRPAKKVINNLVWKGKILRSCKFWDPEQHGQAPGKSYDITGRQDYGLWKEYPITGIRVLHNTMDEVFYGPDILWGIGLSMIRELRRIGSQKFFSETVGQMRPDEIGLLLSRLYRVEAKLPKAFYIRNSDVTPTSPPASRIGNPPNPKFSTPASLYADRHKLSLQEMRGFGHLDIELILKSMYRSAPIVAVTNSIEVQSDAETINALEMAIQSRLLNTTRMIIPLYLTTPSQIAGLYIGMDHGSNSSVQIIYVDPVHGADLPGGIKNWLIGWGNQSFGRATYSVTRTDYQKDSKKKPYTNGSALIYILEHCVEFNHPPDSDDDNFSVDKVIEHHKVYTKDYNDIVSQSV